MANSKMGRGGYDRNAAQIKNKMKEMKNGYKERKDHTSNSGNDRKVGPNRLLRRLRCNFRPKALSFPVCDDGVYA